MVSSVVDKLSRFQLDANQIELEITESMAISESSGIVDSLRAFTDNGVHLAIDDFGTGYSSFARILELPLNRLKLDRYFTKRVHTENDSAAVLKGLIYMAHELDLEVVAEGIENEQQMEFLSNHGCDTLQGFYLSPPLQLKQLEERFIAGLA